LPFEPSVITWKYTLITAPVTAVAVGASERSSCLSVVSLCWKPFLPLPASAWTALNTDGASHEAQPSPAAVGTAAAGPAVTASAASAPASAINRFIRSSP